MEHGTLPDYADLPLGGPVYGIRASDRPALARLLEYEQEHADRLPVVHALQARLGELQEGAEPSGGSPAPPAADAPPAAAATSGPPVGPPSHGNPTNPAQPGPTG